MVLTTHLNADGDGAGSQAAMLAWLESRGIAVRIVNPTPFPDLFRFLVPGEPGFEGVGAPGVGEGGSAGATFWPPEASRILPVTSPEATRWCAAADLAIVLDTGEVSRIGRVRPLTAHLPHWIVDHHPEGDRPLHGQVFRDVTAAATGEMVFDLLQQARASWTPRMASALFVAIQTDTGGFRFSATSAHTLQVAGGLVAYGAHPERLHAHVYGAVPLRRYRLLEAALPSLDQSPDGRVSWMTIPQDNYEALGCDPSDVDGFTEYPRTLEGTWVALVFRHVHEGVKVSFRAREAVDVNAVARTFGGGGHIRASGALIAGVDLDVARARVVAAVLEACEAAAPAILGASGAP
jgi:phosphoesterase RecJ-like protein